MSRPDSSRHETLRLGSRTNAIMATQRPMARAVGDKNMIQKKISPQHEENQRTCLHALPTHRVKTCWRTVHEQPVACQHPDENQQDREGKRQQLRQREAATAAERDPGDKRDTLAHISKHTSLGWDIRLSFSHPSIWSLTLLSINTQEDCSKANWTDSRLHCEIEWSRKANPCEQTGSMSVSKRLF